VVKDVVSCIGGLRVLNAHWYGLKSSTSLAYIFKIGIIAFDLIDSTFFIRRGFIHIIVV
jgi:hypothetical protein